MCLHWGSHYGPKLRRTLHLNYHGFGGPAGTNPGLGSGPGQYAEVLAKELTPRLRAAYEAAEGCY